MWADPHLAGMMSNMLTCFPPDSMSLYAIGNDAMSSVTITWGVRSLTAGWNSNLASANLCFVSMRQHSLCTGIIMTTNSKGQPRCSHSPGATLLVRCVSRADAIDSCKRKSLQSFPCLQDIRCEDQAKLNAHSAGHHTGDSANKRQLRDL